MLWDYSIQTNRKIKPNMPDITIKNKKKNCVLTDLKIHA